MPVLRAAESPWLILIDVVDVRRTEYLRDSSAFIGRAIIDDDQFPVTVSLR